MPSLRSIVYVSSSVIPFSTSDLEDLLLKAKAFNSKHSITGALFYNDGNFIQCIEGPPAEMVLTYDRILKDKRHKGIIQLINLPIPFRAFKSWEMAFVRIGPNRSQELTNALSRTSPNATNKTHPSLVLMNSFISTL